MDHNQPIRIPKRFRRSQVHVWCGKCKTRFSNNTCKQTGKSIGTCRHGQTHRLQVVLYHPNFKKRIVKTLDSRNVEEAVKCADRLKEELREENREQDAPQQKENVQPNTTAMPLLVTTMMDYASYLRGMGVYKHQARTRSETYVKDVERGQLCMIEALQHSGYDVTTLTVDAIDQEAVGAVHSFLDKKYEGRTFNKHLNSISATFNFLHDIQGLALPNPFKSAVRKPLHKNKDIDVLETWEEAEKILDALDKPELGRKKTGKEFKNLWKHWLKPATLLGMYTGRRLSEVIHMKYTDIETDKQGNLTAIRVANRKVNKQQGREAEDGKPIYVPVNNQLHSLLINEFDYEANREKHEYLIRDENMKRASMARHLSRAFSHYAKQALPEREDISFGVLRRTYISQLSDHLGIDNARLVTGHADTKVMEDHYVSKKVVSETARSFELFEAQKQNNQSNENEINR